MAFLCVPQPMVFIEYCVECQCSYPVDSQSVLSVKTFPQSVWDAPIGIWLLIFLKKDTMASWIFTHYASDLMINTLSLVKKNCLMYQICSVRVETKSIESVQTSLIGLWWIVLKIRIALWILTVQSWQSVDV